MQDIGEAELSEAAVEIVPPVIEISQTTAATDAAPETAPIVEGAVEKLDGTDEPAAPAEDRKTTTGIRKPLVIPATVHVEISSDNLLEYVGPPLYQKDRLYTKISPVGVSCGLGYLGNGSGAVMPIEVSVRFAFFLSSSRPRCSPLASCSPCLGTARSSLRASLER